MNDAQDITAARRDWLGLLARAPWGQLATLSQAANLTTSFDWLRHPEVGTVMVRGRIGGTGAAFNLGEISVTRASVQLPTGEIGHGHVQGRDKQSAKWAALVDALMQTDQAVHIRQAVLDPLAKAQHETGAVRAAKAAATKVEFFTLVRGED